MYRSVEKCENEASRYCFVLVAKVKTTESGIKTEVNSQFVPTRLPTRLPCMKEFGWKLYV